MEISADPRIVRFIGTMEQTNPQLAAQVLQFVEQNPASVAPPSPPLPTNENVFANALDPLLQQMSARKVN